MLLWRCHPPIRGATSRHGLAEQIYALLIIKLDDLQVQPHEPCQIALFQTSILHDMQFIFNEQPLLFRCMSTASMAMATTQSGMVWNNSPTRSHAASAVIQESDALAVQPRAGLARHSTVRWFSRLQLLSCNCCAGMCACLQGSARLGKAQKFAKKQLIKKSGLFGPAPGPHTAPRDARWTDLANLIGCWPDYESSCGMQYSSGLVTRTCDTLQAQMAHYIISTGRA